MRAKKSSSKPKKKPQTLQSVTISVLQRQLKKTEEEVRSLSLSLANKEDAQARLERRANAAEDDAEAMLGAIRVLASGVPWTTATGRRVRSEARDLLVSRKITPPSTLGSPRKRAKIKKKKGDKKSVTS